MGSLRHCRTLCEGYSVTLRIVSHPYARLDCDTFKNCEKMVATLSKNFQFYKCACDCRTFRQGEVVTLSDAWIMLLKTLISLFSGLSGFLQAARL
jgi:hypothetical protein